MIIWIASYPKSGNTLVRAILSSLIYCEDGNTNFENLNLIPNYPLRIHLKQFTNLYNNIEDLSKYWIKSQEKINLDKKVHFFKTHHMYCSIKNNYFTNSENTLGVIYVVRDPRNIFTSMKNHFSAPEEEVLKMLFSENLILNQNVPTYPGSWATNYNTWTKNNFKCLTIKFENILNDTKKEIYRIIDFLNNLNVKISVSDEKIKNCIVSTKFENFQAMENKGLFNESVGIKNNKKPFFYLGKKNNWKKLVKKEIINKINNRFKNEMKELGYLI